MDNQWAMLFSNLVTQLPTLLAYLVVIVIALVEWKKYPRPSLLLLAAVAVSLVLTIGFPILQNVIFAQQQLGEIQATQMGWLLSGLGFVSSLIRAVALALMVAAVYVGRQPAPAEPWDES